MKVRRLQNIAKQLLQAEGCSNDTEVSILLTDDAQIAELNKEYRGIDGPTDVLSFSQIEGEDEPIPGVEDNLLGDIVISVETARNQAREQGKTVEQEVDMLLVHGLLHLLGFDHADEEEERIMFSKQNDFLKGLEV